MMLAIGAVLLLFGNGRVAFSAATWGAPLFLLLFLKHARPLLGLAVVWIVCLFAWVIGWRGMIPAPGVWYFVVAAIYATAAFVPFLIHRLIASRLDGLRATFVFPTSWVATQWIFQNWITPYGSWGALAYSQATNSVLIQLASVTGIFGIDFLIAWFASVGAATWNRDWRFARSLRPLCVYCIVLATALAFGVLRLSQLESDSTRVEIALLNPEPQLVNELTNAFALVLSGQELSSSQYEDLLDKAEALNDDLLNRTRVAAEHGADFVAWSETAARVVPSTEPALIDEAIEISRTHNTTLVLGLGVWKPDHNPPLENKLALVSGKETPTYYQKANPIFMAESSVLRSGPEILPILDVSQLRVSAVICHDLDFPALLRQAGKNHADVVFGPSADWPDIADMHLAMAKLRAIENGFFLARPVSGGPTSVIDPLGRICRSAGDMNNTYVYEVAVARTPAIYAYLGDIVAWASVLLLGVLVWCAFHQDKN